MVPVIPTLWKLWLKDPEFVTGLNYREALSQNTSNNNLAESN